MKNIFLSICLLISLLSVPSLVVNVPAFACGGDSKSDCDASIVSRVQMLTDFNNGILADIAEIERMIRDQTVEWEDIKPFVDQIDVKTRKLLKTPEVVQYKFVLESQAPHHFKTETQYCDCSGCRLPTFLGCGFDKDHSWAYRFWRNCGCNDRFSPEPGWGVGCGTLLCMGVQCYVYQGMIMPFLPSSWDCSRCGVGSIGCPLHKKVKANEVKAWLASLRQGLQNLNKYLTPQPQMAAPQQPVMYRGYQVESAAPGGVVFAPAQVQPSAPQKDPPPAYQ